MCRPAEGDKHREAPRTSEAETVIQEYPDEFAW